MDLSCWPSREQDKYPLLYLLPGTEVNETPLGDDGEHHHRSSRVKMKGSGSSAV